MKKNIINKLFLGGALLCAGVMTSCDDFLTILPTNSIPDENFWQSKSDVDNVRAAAYEQATKNSVLERVLYWGEYRSDNVQIANMSNTDLQNTMEGVLQPTNNMFKWGDFYTGISYCNKVLENGQRMIDENIDPTFSLGEWRPIKAEMTALRALYYFYLVRAYRDVPYVEKTITTDAEALAARNGQAAMPAVQLLEKLINQLEECRAFAAKNYGNVADNKGRFTRSSIAALEADICLWEACLLKNARAKSADASSYVLLDENGAEITDQAVYNSRATEYLNKAVALCDEIIKEIDDEYRKEINLRPTFYEQEEKDQPYPLYRQTNRTQVMDAADQVYNEIWYNKNSRESLFELQFDGVNVKNGAMTQFFNSGGGTPTVSGKDVMFSSVTNVENGTQKGYSKTDMRMLENVKVDAKASTYLIRKNIYTQVSFVNLLDMNQGKPESNEEAVRQTDSQNSNWPVYRLSDVMMIKAECLARLNSNLNEGFRLVIELFKRNNPGLYATGDGAAPDGAMTSDFIVWDSENGIYSYGNDKSANDLLALVYRERQREFFAEGKRWFDIVRQAESINDTQTPLESWVVAPKNVLTRLRKLASLYVPYHDDEMKVNPALVQNPIWDKYTPISSKPTGK